ncbi:MAG: helix-turn-helix domain-containing protein [Acidobacteria bacterium]|nr:helix-turn-helix domain-containing protein [Acidobacteriota bacterium]
MSAADILRKAREARGRSLSEVAAETRITVQFIQQIEAGRFDALPSGIYARAYLKAYAAAVGLDPLAILAQFEEDLPRADESLTFIVKSRTADRNGSSAQVPVARGREPAASLPLHPARPVRMEEPPRPRQVRYVGAMLVDAMLLTALHGIFIGIGALLCGVDTVTLLQQATWPMAVLFATLALSYFGLLGGIAGRTCGAFLLGIRFVEPATRPVSLAQATRRGLRCVLKEAFVLIDVIIATMPGHGYRF